MLVAILKLGALSFTIKDITPRRWERLGLAGAYLVTDLIIVARLITSTGENWYSLLSIESSVYQNRYTNLTLNFQTSCREYRNFYISSKFLTSHDDNDYLVMQEPSTYFNMVQYIVRCNTRGKYDMEVGPHLNTTAKRYMPYHFNGPR